MYDVLVDRLRNLSHFEIGNAESVINVSAEAVTVLRETAQQAADAIKELQNKYDTVTSVQKHVIENLRNDLDFAIRAEAATINACMPRWIPVTERLPEDGKFVLVCNDDGHMMIAKHETETYEWYYKYTNYDFDIWDNEEQGPVRYWMQLPEPPKEET